MRGNEQDLMVSFSTVVIIGVVITLIGLIFFVKIWIACNRIVKLTSINEDLQFWARAKYESDKRLGVITEADADSAEQYLKKY